MECPWCSACDVTKYLFCPEASLDLNLCKICGVVFSGSEQKAIDYSIYNKHESEQSSCSSELDVFYDLESERKYLFGRAQKVIEQIGKKDFSLLDIGAGPGSLLAEIKNRYPHALLHGVEPSIHNVYSAKENYGIDLVNGNWEGQVGRRYDIITIFGSLMLHPSPKKSLLLAVDCLNPGGVLIFDFKNHKSATRLVLRRFANYFPHGLARRKLLRQGFHGMPWGLSKKPISELMENAGVEVLSIYQLPGRNVDLGFNVSPLMLCSKVLDRLFNAQSWVEFVVRRSV